MVAAPQIEKSFVARLGAARAHVGELPDAFAIRC